MKNKFKDLAENLKKAIFYYKKSDTKTKTKIIIDIILDVILLLLIKIPFELLEIIINDYLLINVQNIDFIMSVVSIITNIIYVIVIISVIVIMCNTLKNKYKKS